MAFRRTHENVFQIITRLKKRGIPFSFEVQNETWTVKSKSGSVTTRSAEYSVEDLNFIRGVKEYIRKSGVHLKYKDTLPDGHKTAYYSYSENLQIGDVFDSPVNIDLNSAYWETANKLGLLSDDIYQKGLVIRKQVRLSALGSLAKKKRIYEFNGTQQKFVSETRSEDTEFLWDIICTYVGSVLLEAAKACGNDFIYFWVDGIYIKGKALKKVERIFKKAGYQYKIIQLDKISVTKDIIEVYGKDGKDKPKPFPCRLDKQRFDHFQGFNTDL